MNAWPSTVIEAAQRDELVLVIGAGVSANSEIQGLRPPGWADLIRELAERAGFNASEKLNLEQQIEHGDLLDAAEMVKWVAISHGKEQDVYTALRRLTDGATGNEYKGNSWHEAVLMLSPRIIVTTNYDKIIERASSNGFAVHLPDSKNVGSAVRGGNPVLIKMHGSVDSPEQAILTQTDYSKLSIIGRHCLEVVQALLMTRTALFIGYSLGDPDIKLLLQNCLTSIDHVPSHYILTETLETHEKRKLRDSFGLNAIEFPTGNFAAGLELLSQFQNLAHE